MINTYQPEVNCVDIDELFCNSRETNYMEDIIIRDSFFKMLYKERTPIWVAAAETLAYDIHKDKFLSKYGDRIYTSENLIDVIHKQLHESCIKPFIHTLAEKINDYFKQNTFRISKNVVKRDRLIDSLMNFIVNDFIEKSYVDYELIDRVFEKYKDNKLIIILFINRILYHTLAWHKMIRATYDMKRILNQHIIDIILSSKTLLKFYRFVIDENPDIVSKYECTTHFGPFSYWVALYVDKDSERLVNAINKIHSNNEKSKSKMEKYYKIVEKVHCL